MRRIILSLHTSLDGFIAGPDGSMDWIRTDEEMFDFVGTFTGNADLALYGRLTYEIMDSYWPKAGEKPDASRHDMEHSQWYNAVDKLVISKTRDGQTHNKTQFIGSNIIEEIKKRKKQKGRNIIIFGSASTAHMLMSHNLIDDYWLFVNPVILGDGIPFFADISEKINLQLQDNKIFPCGVIGLHYTVQR